MTFKTLICGLLLPALCFAQSKDLPGYFIDSKSQTHQVMFKYGDFKNIDGLEYKEGNDESYKSLASQNVTEYGIGDDYKVKKMLVTHDPEFGTVSSDKNPKLVTETLFLNVLLEGTANLYSYESNGVDKYFFDVKGGQAGTTQLILHQFHESDITSIKENRYYRQQLDKEFKCQGITSADFADLSYSKNSLTSIFKKYNACKGTESKLYSNKTGNKIKLRLDLFAGINWAGFKVKTQDTESSAAHKPSYAVGAEVALMLPARTSEFFVRGEYEQFKGTTTTVVHYTTHAFNTEETDYTYDSGFVNVYGGFRKNFQSHTTGHVYADLSVAVSIPTGDIASHLYHPDAPGTAFLDNELETHSCFFFNIGLGYAINPKWAVDLRYSTPRDMFSNLPTNNKTMYSSLGLNVRYSLN